MSAIDILYIEQLVRIEAISVDPFESAAVCQRLDRQSLVHGGTDDSHPVLRVEVEDTQTGTAGLPLAPRQHDPGDTEGNFLLPH